MKQLNNIISIYSPNKLAKPGLNTAKLFAQLPEPVEQKLDIFTLREAVAEWDRDCSFSYPKEVPISAFTEEVIHNISACVYRTSSNDYSTPTILLIHGGGFVCELAKIHKSFMANIAARFPCHGILPHYALAPENKAPKAINEVTSLLQALLTDPEKYGLTKNIFVVGYSSGGNLAWNAILNVLNSSATREAAIRNISHLFLMSPWVDISMKTTKSGPYQNQQNSDKMLQTWGLEQMRDWYLTNGATGMEPLYSPVFRDPAEMKTMPKTTVIVGEIDCLLSDAVETTRILRSAGVPTDLVVLEGQSHNHSAHVGLRDGVFTPDIISAVMQRKAITHLKGTDGLGLKIAEDDYSITNLKTTLLRAKLW